MMFIYISKYTYIFAYWQKYIESLLFSYKTSLILYISCFEEILVYYINR
jgi:hypothetical protein